MKRIEMVSEDLLGRAIRDELSSVRGGIPSCFYADGRPFNTEPLTWTAKSPSLSQVLFCPFTRLHLGQRVMEQQRGRWGQSAARPQFRLSAVRDAKGCAVVEELAMAPPLWCCPRRSHCA